MKPTVAEMELSAVARLQTNIYKDLLSVHIRKHGDTQWSISSETFKKTYVAPVYEILHWEAKQKVRENSMLHLLKKTIKYL